MTKTEIKEMFLDIFNRTNPEYVISDAQGSVTGRNEICGSLNVSSIASRLITEAGRWCERYASDFLITWDSAREAMDKHMATNDILETEIFIFGFRSSGVDHDTYVASAMNSYEHMEYRYRKIYAVKIRDKMDDDSYCKTVHVTLKDIMHETEMEQFHRKHAPKTAPAKIDADKIGKDFIADIDPFLNGKSKEDCFIYADGKVKVYATNDENGEPQFGIDVSCRNGTSAEVIKTSVIYADELSAESIAKAITILLKSTNIERNSTYGL